MGVGLGCLGGKGPLCPSDISPASGGKPTTPPMAFPRAGAGLKPAPTGAVHNYAERWHSSEFRREPLLHHPSGFLLSQE